MCPRATDRLTQKGLHISLYARIAGLESDLARLPDDATRARVLAAVRSDRRLIRAAMIEGIVSFSLLFVGNYALLSFAASSARFSLLFYTVVMLAAPFTGYANAAVNRRLLQRILRERLRAYFIPLCLHCGYNLLGMSGERCPECGEMDVEVAFPDEDVSPFRLSERLSIGVAGLRRELTHLGDADAQRRFWRQVRGRCAGRQTVLFWIVLPVAIACASLGSIFVAIVASSTTFPITYLFAAYMVTVGSALLAAVLWSNRLLLRAEFAQLRNEAGMPVCRRCGYDLRGTPNRICPECGTLRE